MTSPIGKSRHDQMEPAGGSPDDERLVPGAGAPPPDGPQPAAAAARTSARGAAESTSLSARWPEIQAMFVDDPRASVEMAAELTDDSVEVLIASVKQQQHALLSAWQGTDADTENLRTTLRAYRTFWSHVDAFARDA